MWGMRPGKLREAREGAAKVLISGAFKILAPAELFLPRELRILLSDSSYLACGNKI